MFALLKNANVFTEGRFRKASVFVANGEISFVGEFDELPLAKLAIDVEILDCKGAYLVPGLIDPHAHLSGGSGERGGFITQSPRILVSECVEGGVTTLVGTLGVDTTTKTMSGLLASVKALREGGLTAFCYTGGYDVPPKTITSSVRDDIIFIEEIIGVGEIAIADRRAPEPSVDALARCVVDAYVAGMLTGKAGVTHFHVGEGRHRLKVARDLLERHEVERDHLYFTHVERNEGLMDEAIAMAKLGSYIDLDICDRDLVQWIKYYRQHDGRRDRLTVSSDAGIGSPGELWSQIRDCVTAGGFPLEEMLMHVTENPARVLKLHKKGRIEKGRDADLLLVDAKDLSITHVMSRGRWLMRDEKFRFPERPDMHRRGLDLYEISKD